LSSSEIDSSRIGTTTMSDRSENDKASAKGSDRLVIDCTIALAESRSFPGSRASLYERPPLSKAVLLGKASPADAPIAGPKGLAGHGVKLECGNRCIAFDGAARLAAGLNLAVG
jgi:hypothetical protein